MLAAAQHPSQRQLRHADSFGRRELREPLEHFEICRKSAGLEARHAAAKILGLKRRYIFQAAREETPRERAESHEGRAQLPAALQNSDLGFARPQRIFTL